MPTYDTQAAVNAAWGESLTYTRSGTGRVYTVTGGRHLQGTAEGVTSYGVYLIQKERYTLATDALPFDPRPSDTLGPVGRSARTVVSTSGSPFLKFWTVEAQYPCLVDDLDQTATVYRPAPTATDEGFRNPNLAAVYTDYAVRLQPDTREMEWDTAGGVKTRAKFVCIFGSAVVLSAGDNIEVGGVRYEFKGQSEVESLGLLTFAACERIS